MAKFKMEFSTKRLLIEKANSTIVIIVGVAAFVTAFSLVSCRSLLAKRSYQARVINAQETARDQLRENLEAVDSLEASYKEFAARPENIIAGNTTGTGERDGDNAKLVLDALPSKYDFPALIASIEKIVADRNYRIQSISGTDEEVGQSGGSSSSSASSTSPAASTTAQTPGAPVPMPFQLTAEGQYGAMIELLAVFQRSIRPLYAQSLIFRAGNPGTVEMSYEGNSFYLPEKTLQIKHEVVQ